MTAALAPCMSSSKDHPTVAPVSAQRFAARERLDAILLRSLGERRALRTRRHSGPSAWDRLEAHVARAATLLWEVSTLPFRVFDDLLAYCAFLARELEVTEALDLSIDAERYRFAIIAPSALATLDEIDTELSRQDLGSIMICRSLRRVFSDIRFELTMAQQLACAA